MRNWTFQISYLVDRRSQVPQSVAPFALPNPKYLRVPSLLYSKYQTLSVVYHLMIIVRTHG
jgi:hypothetical protein